MNIKLTHKYAAVAKLKKPGDWIVASRVKKNKSYVEDAVALLDNQKEGLCLRWLDGTERSVTCGEGLNCFWLETSGNNWIDTHFASMAHRGVKQ